jgi:hypothetical protein
MDNNNKDLRNLIGDSLNRISVNRMAQKIERKNHFRELNSRMFYEPCGHFVDVDKEDKWLLCQKKVYSYPSCDCPVCNKDADANKIDALITDSIEKRKYKKTDVNLCDTMRVNDTYFANFTIANGNLVVKILKKIEEGSMKYVFSINFEIRG